ncbi:hypothetical protein C8Q72DRAFT_159889 [Fomitopsis betulina]|nr:hypothetical protein C8Q72DRAFT_159889 [Fomitopsis betulina]
MSQSPPAGMFVLVILYMMACTSSRHRPTSRRRLLNSVSTSYSATTIAFAVTNTSCSATVGTGGATPLTSQTPCTSPATSTTLRTPLVFPIPVYQTFAFTQTVAVTLYGTWATCRLPKASVLAPGPLSQHQLHHKHEALDTAVIAGSLGLDDLKKGIDKLGPLSVLVPEPPKRKGQVKGWQYWLPYASVETRMDLALDTLSSIQCGACRPGASWLIGLRAG